MGRINQQALSQNHTNGSPSQLGGGGLISLGVAAHPHTLPPSSPATQRAEDTPRFTLHWRSYLPLTGVCAIPRLTPHTVKNTGEGPWRGFLLQLLSHDFKQ